MCILLITIYATLLKENKRALLLFMKKDFVRQVGDLTFDKLEHLSTYACGEVTLGRFVNFGFKTF